MIKLIIFIIYCLLSKFFVHEIHWHNVLDIII